VVLTGCATTTQKETEQNDPWQGWNKGTQSFNDSFDKHLLKPVAIGYLDVTNNDPDNLTPMNYGEHAAYHRRLKQYYD
jgi:ABC-type transporter lipoprotein component MlaA